MSILTWRQVFCDREKNVGDNELEFSGDGENLIITDGFAKRRLFLTEALVDEIIAQRERINDHNVSFISRRG